MDEYSHGREHSDLTRELRDACARLDAHLLEHEGLAVPHHRHSAAQDIVDALHDLATGAEEPGEGEKEPEASEEPGEEPATEEPGEEPAAEGEPSGGEEHPPTVDDLLPPEPGEEGEPKRAHPMFARVFGS